VAAELIALLAAGLAAGVAAAAWFSSAAPHASVGTAEARLGEALDALGTTFAIYDRDDRLVYRNRAFVARLGPFAPTGLGSRFPDMIDALLAGGHIDTGGRTAAEWRAWRMARHAAADGSAATTFTSGTVLQVLEQRTPDGGVALTGTDVTALHQRQTQMERQSQVLTRVFESIDEGILVYDRDARLVAWNGRAAGIIDIPADMLYVGAPFVESVEYQIRRGDFGPIEDPAAEVARRLELNRTQASVSEGWRPNGRYIRAQRTMLAGGGWVTLFVDLTERRRFEEALRAAKESAERANRSKSEFLAHMSHELRTPLNAIIGFSEIIEREYFGPVGAKRYVEYARDIHASGTHLLNVIGDILDIAKAEAGSTNLDEGPVDLGELVRASARLIEPRAKAGQVRVAADVAGSMPKVRGDARRLKQVLINLLANAVKFTPPGGRVTAEARLDPDGGTVLAVRDTGIGMRPEDIPRALEPFAQVDSALSRRFEGTGLGLPLSRKLVELHGGSLAVESEPGHGTTVTVRLPAARTLPE
jgi:signal transduction histidine kinase